MKIKIYTGLTVDTNSCVLDYLHPKYQLENIRLWLELKESFELHTNSDFIIREINYFITEGKLEVEDVEFYEDDVLVEGDESGFESKSIDEVIEEQNIRCEESYYKRIYGDIK